MSGRLLIAGGTGFIGHHLACFAMEMGIETTVLSLSPPADYRRIKDVEYIQANLVDLVELHERLTLVSFDYVVNLSGYIDHSCFLMGGREVVNAHFNGVQNLLQLLDWKRLKRFVQIGSSDEYGGLSAPQREGMREAPISPYSLGKVASTHLLQMLHRTEGLPVVVLRLFLVYGPGQDDRRFLPQVIKGCQSGNSFPVSEGKQLRDFCYVDDIVKGILMALKSDTVNGEVINLASGEAVSIRSIIELVRKTVGRGQPKFGQVPYRSGENMELYADISRARERLNWEPEFK